MIVLLGKRQRINGVEIASSCLPTYKIIILRFVFYKMDKDEKQAIFLIVIGLLVTMWINTIIWFDNWNASIIVGVLVWFFVKKKPII